MDENKKKEVLDKILKYYQNRHIVLDDIDHYMAGAKAVNDWSFMHWHKGNDAHLLRFQEERRILN